MLRNLAIVGAISLALLPPMYLGIAYPVNAQEAPKCVTPADVEKQAGELGAWVVGGGTYNGKNSDEVLIFQGPSAISFFFFKDGCMVDGANLDEAVPEKDA
jgi:hypothetical protein